MDRFSKLFLLAAFFVMAGFSTTFTEVSGSDLTPILISDPIENPTQTDFFNALEDTTWQEIKKAWYSGKPVRLLRGVTYEVGANDRMIDPKCNPCYLGAHGVGPKPILKTTPTNALYNSKFSIFYL